MYVLAIALTFSCSFYCWKIAYKATATGATYFCILCITSKQSEHKCLSQLSLFQVHVFIKLTIEIQSNISSAAAGNSLTDSSKTLSKALASESGHEHIISSLVQKHTLDLMVKAKFSQTEQQYNLLTTSLLYLGSSCASPSTCQG